MNFYEDKKNIPSMRFELEKTDAFSSARAATIHTEHGTIKTPIFMPVGTAAAVKSVHIRDLKDDINAQIILGNTYHLYLRPGMEVMQAAGGLHRFNGWDRPILTDSGGYQVFSLAASRKISEEGVLFRSHIDGSKHQFSPEKSIDIQRVIGGDIIMAFDECPPYPSDYNYAKNSMQLTHRWLDRCIRHVENTEPLYGHTQTLFPIVQGGTYPDLRRESAAFIASKGAEGNAIGGLSVGEPHEKMYEMTDLVCRILPKDKARYLMGVGTPQNILEGIALGVDMFDCVLPTRNARHGHLYTAEGVINIKNEKWKQDFSPLDEQGLSFVDREYSKAYLRHLFTVKENLAGMIASLHNLAFFLWLTGQARQHILVGDFAQWKETMIQKLSYRR